MPNCGKAFLIATLILIACDDENILIDCDGGKYDEKTDLCWQNPPNEDVLGPTEAVTYCDELVLADHDDWRLPEFDELYSIISSCSKATSVDDPPNENGEKCDEFEGPSDKGCYWDTDLTGSCELTYWSSTLFGPTNYQWYIDFSNAYWDCNEGGSRFTRCVRNGK